MHDDRIEIVRPMSHDSQTTTTLGLLTLLAARCEAAAELALTEQDRRIFTGLAADVRRIDKNVVAERIVQSQDTLEALQRVTDALAAHR